MKITTGARFNGRFIDVSLDSSDGFASWPERWESWNAVTKIKMLTAAADLHVILYAEREGLLTPEEIDIKKKHHAEILSESLR